MKPLLGIIKDTHLKANNTEIVFDIFEQFVHLLKANDVVVAIHLGDFFSERKEGHSLDRLMVIKAIIDLFRKNAILLYAINGNHDKTDLSAAEGYMHLYEQDIDSDDYFQLFSTHGNIFFNPSQGRIGIHFIPYFLEGPAYMDQLNYTMQYVKSDVKNVLMTHVAINGVRNNDGTIVTNGIPVEAFKRFDKVILGHYHEESFIPPNIYYIPGSYQQNYGETEHKGFTLLYPDLSMKFFKSKFKPYKKLVVPANNKAAIQEIYTELKKLPPDSTNVRIVFTGSQVELENVDVRAFKDLGVSTKWENTNEVQVGFDELEQAPDIVLSKGEILKSYIRYAKEFELNTAQRNHGLQLLKQIR